PNLGHIAGARQECERRLRTDLGDAAFSATFASGAELTVEQAFDYALGNKVDDSPPAPRPKAGPVLTRRQLEVAKLVADGMSNKDIAASLIISQRTADAHVEHILTKLDFEHRVLDLLAARKTVTPHLTFSHVSRLEEITDEGLRPAAEVYRSAFAGRPYDEIFTSGEAIARLIHILEQQGDLLLGKVDDVVTS